MIVAVKTREFKRDLDYDWEDFFPSDKALVFEAGTFHRALEGADDDSRFAALFRPAAGVGVTLGVSVSTTREDAVGRPLRTIAFLRATDAKETALLASFFAECLLKKDEETLYDPESSVAKAVESLYQTKMPDEFLAFCKSLKPVASKEGAPENRWAIPRNDEGERKSLADALSAAITGDSSFFFALTDRRWTDVLASLGSMFDRGTVWIFSKATTAKEPIPGGPPNTRAVAAAIGGTVLLALLVAAIGGPCSRRSEDGEAVASTNSLDRAVESRVVATNSQAGIGLNATNAVPTERRSIEPAGETQPGGVSTNVAPASSETPTSLTNETAPFLIGGGGESDASTNHLERASGGKVLVTNAQASVGLDGVSTNSAPAATETPTSLTNEADSSFIGGGGESDASTNLLSRAIDGEDVSTNAQASGGIDATNAVPIEEQGINPAVENLPDVTCTNIVPTEAEASAAVTNNPAESPAIRNGETK